VAFPLVLLAKAATRLIAAHHAAQQGTAQDGGRVWHLPKELLAGGSESDHSIFHFYTMKVPQIEASLQEKNNRTLKNFLDQRTVFGSSDPGQTLAQASLKKCKTLD
jgi:hypothetical protein